jgi:predicted secreted protein
MLVPGGQYDYVYLHNAATATANGGVIECIHPDRGALSIASFQISGISGDTVTFEVPLEVPGTWVGILVENVTTGVEATTATADGCYRCTIAGMKKVRARLTRVSGTVTVIGVAMS